MDLKFIWHIARWISVLTDSVIKCRELREGG